MALVYEHRKLVKRYLTGTLFDEEEAAFEERFFENAYGGVQRDFPLALRERSIEVYSPQNSPDYPAMSLELKGTTLRRFRKYKET